MTILEQYKYETEERGLDHKTALDQMKWMFSASELKGLDFLNECNRVSEELGLEIIDSYDDGGSPSEFEDDGILHVIEGSIRVAFDVSNNQNLPAHKQNVNTKLVLDALGRKITKATLV